MVFHIAPHCDNLNLMNVVVPLILALMVSCEQNHKVTFCFDHLHLTSAKVPLTMLSASYDADAVASGITWLKKSCGTLFQLLWHNRYNGAIDEVIALLHVCWWHNMTTKGHITPCVDCLNLNYKMVLLMILASHNAKTSVSSVTRPKSNIAPLFNHLWLMTVVVYHWWCHCYHVTTMLAPVVSCVQKRPVAPHFNFLT